MTLFVCAFGQLGAVMCVEDYVFVLCVCVRAWLYETLKLKTGLRLCADEHDAPAAAASAAVKSVSPQPFCCRKGGAI